MEGYFSDYLCDISPAAHFSKFSFWVDAFSVEQ